MCRIFVYQIYLQWAVIHGISLTCCLTVSSDWPIVAFPVTVTKPLLAIGKQLENVEMFLALVTLLHSNYAYNYYFTVSFYVQWNFYWRLPTITGLFQGTFPLPAANVMCLFLSRFMSIQKFLVINTNVMLLHVRGTSIYSKSYTNITFASQCS